MITVWVQAMFLDWYKMLCFILFIDFYVNCLGLCAVQNFNFLAHLKFGSVR